MIKIKVRFEDCLEPIPSASTTKEISILAVFQTHPALRAPAVHGVSSINTGSKEFVAHQVQTVSE